MCDWVNDHIPKSAHIADMGCGNGCMLFALARDYEFTKLTGLDYSVHAVALAQAIAASMDLEWIQFSAFDLFKQHTNYSDMLDVVMDKGTFDAISLAPPQEGVVWTADYVRHVHTMLNTDGHLVLSSCNWTKAELLTHFDAFFTLVDEVPYRTFTFGGVQGQTVTTLIFKKR
jgi:2-polyprenyl-3-methyl-5-hydroxy-6-metoxy-1,4-benzoquinol methylase